ncbi:unnamed protein product [Rhizoctonia solani]|uniref:Uncharacterized protein n=1 Tax=Rhizoctonia solani TaxID=456999 RepID=A0A8H3HSJ9_9AGAM|nr:unnamed protein product [Rhizoctonia solani]
MVTATGLTIPLDQWVCASALPSRLNFLLQSCSSPRDDYSHLNIDDALPLLSHACKIAFGDLMALEFEVKVSQGPLAYSAVLTITGPDEIGIEFPGSGNHPTQELAKMHAAYKAVLGGAIGYIMQSAGPATMDSNEAPVNVPTPPKRGVDPVPKKTSSDLVNGTDSPVKQGKKPRGTKSGAPPDALNLINTFLQRVYRYHNTPMPKTSREWKIVFFGGGVTARLTIQLPSGKSRSYGELPGMLSKPGRHPKVYPSPAVAKREVADEAIRAGILEFIECDKPGETTTPKQPPSPTTATVRAHNPLSSYVAYDPVKASRTTGANSVPVSKTADTLANGLPLQPFLSEQIVGEAAPTQDLGPVPPLEQMIDHTGTTSNLNTPPHHNEPPSPVDEMEVVDDLLGPGSLSNLESSEQEDEDEVDELTSSVYGDELPSGGRSESMELDSDTDSPPKQIAVTFSEYRASLPEEEPEPGDEAPCEEQRTEPPESPIQQVNQELDHQEPIIMLGASYSSILSDFCFERGHAQPQVTYQRNFEHAKAEGPVIYTVSIVLGTSRFELSKQYESIELAEEKLSRRILRQFGVRAKKM